MHAGRVVPFCSRRAASKAKDSEKLAAAPSVGEVAAIYIGGGVPDHLIEAIGSTPVASALEQRLSSGGTVVAIAAAAQCMGVIARSVFGGNAVTALGWLEGGVVEPNFDPEHDRRLRQMMRQPGVRWGVGIPAGAALLLGPDGAMEVVDQIYVLGSPDGDYNVLEEDDTSNVM